MTIKTSTPGGHPGAIGAGTTWRPQPTLTGIDYVSAEVYGQERERIWFDRWVCIGRAEEVPESGDYLVRELAGESLLIARNRDGELRAFYNV